MRADPARPPGPALGVLGGMGPAATADFLARLARVTPARRDQDHPPTIVYSDPGTPDRSDAILGCGPSPLPAMVRGINFLNQVGCALIAIPCNTAHYWYKDLAAQSTVPILHIAEATAAALRTYAPNQTVGVLATDGTLQSGIYSTWLSEAGITTVDLAAPPGASPVMRGIRALKAGQPTAARELLHDAARRLVRQGAETLLVACTDVSTALVGVDVVDGVPLVDASDCLARACLNRLGDQPA